MVATWSEAKVIPFDLRYSTVVVTGSCETNTILVLGVTIPERSATKLRYSGMLSEQK